MPAETSQEELLRLVDRLNADEQVHGILVQLPLPRHIQEAAVIAAVSPLKDVDGFGPVSLGLLTTGQPRYLPCTPAGVQQLLQQGHIVEQGTHDELVAKKGLYAHLYSSNYASFDDIPEEALDKSASTDSQT